MASAMRRLASLKPDMEMAELEYLDLVDLRPLWGRLCSMPRLATLKLNGNKLATLPADMSALRTLRALDITQNMFSSVTAILPGLRSLPALTELTITVSEQEEEILLVSLPRLTMLNGVMLDGAQTTPASHATPSAPQQQQPPPPSQHEQAQQQPQLHQRPPRQQRSTPTEAAANNPPRAETISLTKQDLEELQQLFVTIKALRKPLPAAQDQRMTVAFENHVQTVVARLQDRLKTIQDSAKRQTEILMAKHGLYDICFQEAMTYARIADPDLSTIMQRLCGVHSTLFEQSEGLLVDAASDRIKLQRDLKHAESETNQLLEAAEQLEAEAGAHHNELVALRTEVRRLQAENEQLQARPGAAKAMQSSNGGVAGSPIAANGQGANRRAPGQQTPARQAASATVGPPQTPGGPNKIAVTDTAGTTYNVRNLTLKQLKDYIDQIQASKEKFDAKCADMGLPRETMEMHMYSFLNNRFGLKQIIVETATAIIKALDKFKKEDNDVAVFAKVFRNEIDEEFHRVQRQIKDTVADLLRIHLKGKHRLKGDDVINETLREKMNSVLVEEEWSNIVKYMYNPEDSATLGNLIHDTCHQEVGEAREQGVDRPVDSISYTGLVRLLLDFQLRGHDRFLLRFRTLFRAVDTDGDGVIDEDQFRALVLKVSPSRDDDEVNELLHSVDPSNTRRVTFSDAVACLSPDIVDMMITVARAVNPNTTADEASSTAS